MVLSKAGGFLCLYRNSERQAIGAGVSSIETEELHVVFGSIMGSDYYGAP